MFIAGRPMDGRGGGDCGKRSTAIPGFVPFDHLIGRAETVLFSLYACRRADGAECAAPRLWRAL